MALLSEIDILPYYYFKIQNHIFVYFLREKVENHFNQHKLIELLNPTRVTFKYYEKFEFLFLLL